jgi:hypothetical protein
VRSFKPPKGPEASFILFLWSHSGNWFWMLRLEIYYFDLIDTRHCVTLLGSLVEEWKLALLSPTSKYVCFKLVFAADHHCFKIRRTPRKPHTCSADEIGGRKPPCPEWGRTVLYVLMSLTAVVFVDCTN